MAEVKLPDGWAEINLEHIISISSGMGLTKTKMIEGPIPVFGGNGITGWHNTPNVYESTIVIGRVGFYCGSVHLTPQKAWITDNAFITNFNSTFLDKAFLFKLLTATNLRDDDSSTAQPVISGRKVYPIKINLPPHAEQKVIADKLDTLLAQVENTKARLDRIPQILKTFRQSVLAAAVSGKLTEEWRNIQSEKISKWRSVTLGEIADIKGGITKDSKKQELSFVELPYLRVANVQRYYLDLTEIKTIRVPESRVKDLLLHHGDILFNEGGDLDKLGRGWIWENQIQNCSYQNHVFRARLKDKLDSPKYISWWGNTEGFEYFIRNGKQTTNLASINKTLLSHLPIKLPPSNEQTEIVRRVEQLFAYADKIEQQVKAAQQRVDKLTQSILAKAFRGELSADWRTANPDLVSGNNSAHALLERIKVQCASTAAGKKSKRVKTS